MELIKGSNQRVIAKNIELLMKKGKNRKIAVQQALRSAMEFKEKKKASTRRRKKIRKIVNDLGNLIRGEK